MLDLFWYNRQHVQCRYNVPTLWFICFLVYLELPWRVYCFLAHHTTSGVSRPRRSCLTSPAWAYKCKNCVPLQLDSQTTGANWGEQMADALGAGGCYKNLGNVRNGIGISYTSPGRCVMGKSENETWGCLYLGFIPSVPTKRKHRYFKQALTLIIKPLSLKRPDSAYGLTGFKGDNDNKFLNYPFWARILCSANNCRACSYVQKRSELRSYRIIWTRRSRCLGC